MVRQHVAQAVEHPCQLLPSWICGLAPKPSPDGLLTETAMRTGPWIFIHACRIAVRTLGSSADRGDGQHEPVRDRQSQQQSSGQQRGAIADELRLQ
ncbi:hypothetical protein Pth03_69470 [Planotetraspora thailandica]|uniref:Uncharacterized protein n=1 Tax=Planotetraspora thailandica TaxID=487172 RepID=A0A8J4DDH7_9ACTN|nr:hypothetical protein [Planotetraspora thailandica]GII58558.1 hypothetical protein Pth03_69470 [Planotetraspora thailandica]